MKIRPLRDYIFVRKAVNGDEEDYHSQKYFWKGNIVVSAGTADNTNFAEIIAVGPMCKYFSDDNIGEFIMVPELSNDMHRIIGEDFAIRETAIPVLATFS